MNNLWLLTIKNLKLLIRAKGSALIVVFAPLLIILIMGLSFNNSAKYALNLGVQTTSSGSDVDAFISTLQEQEFKVIKYNLSEDCIGDVKSGYIHTCIILPDSFKVDSNTPREITFYVDPSKINLVWMVQQTLEKKLNLKSQEISQVLAQDLFAKLSDTNTKVATEKAKVGGVKDKNTGAATNTESAKTELGKIDLAPPTTIYNTSVVTDFKTAIATKISNGTASITAAKSSVNSIENLSSTTKASIINHLNEANAGFTNITTLLDATSGANSLGEISALITTLQNDVTSTKNKLTAASAQIKTTSANLDNVKSVISEGATNLESIQKVLEEINVNLNAQKVTDAKVVSSPLITKIEKVAPEKTYLNYTFPALLILVIMFSSLLLGTTLVMMEKNSPAFTRNYFLPVNKVTFVLSTYLTNLILIVVQLIVILGISLAFLPEIYVSLLPIALILFLAASVFTFLGMAIGYVFISEETAVLASISLGSVLLFMSGLILPLESVSPLLRDIVYFNPFVIAESLVRELLLFQSSLTILWMDIATLFVYALVLFLFILVLESLIHQRVITKFFHQSHQKHKELQKQVQKGP